jgi:hypothetical protein
VEFEGKERQVCFFVEVVEVVAVCVEGKACKNL